MSKQSIEELKKLFASQKEKKESFGTRENNFYPFWNMNEDESSSVRILPIANAKSALPFVEKDQHKLSINGKDETFACPAMFDEVCPVCELAKKYYALAKQAEKNRESGEKIEELKNLGKYYYRQRSHIAVAYIKKDALPVDSESGENYEGKVKAIQFGNQLYTKFNTQLDSMVANGDIDDVPWDLNNGIDFNITKKIQGKFAKWDTASEFARRSTSLPQEFIDSYEPVDVTKYLPNNLGSEKVQRMLDAHLNGSILEDETSTPTMNIPTQIKVKEELEDHVQKVEHKEETTEAKIEIKKESVEEPEDDIEAMLRQLRRNG